jgi:parallel beta-helix repeat protein
MKLFPTVKATYVEGPVTQDTVWTLVDSPFVMSKDVIVYPNATLTIEPEVEIKFGGNFSLIVEGKLFANGTRDKVIRFASNKDEPIVGDWGTIRLNGTETSILVYCIIEYGTNGITIENGTLNIQNSFVCFNSENGIMITNGSVTVKDNKIANNTMSGMYIAGGNQVTVQHNIIMSNEDGITLTGNLTSEININQNNISLNRHSGILLESDTYDNTDIRNNTLSTNSYGFYVSTNASTVITRNYILNNTFGIFYEKGTDHKAHFNDIYDNDAGMDVSPNAAVNAEYNYWGDRSGPYHESLNPRGKGNRVRGDGVNLDFIFFLTAPIDYDNICPTAILWTDKTLVAPNQTLTFIGTDSYDEGQVDQYFFDFGDGTNTNWTTLSLFSYRYLSKGIYNASLIVMDDFGAKSDANFTIVRVENLIPLEVSMTLSNYIVDYNEEVLVTVYVSLGGNPVEKAGVTLFSVKGGSFTPISGLTNSTGYFTATFTAPNVTEITNVRIIARASRTGYADGSDYDYLKVLPPLIVQVVTEPTPVKSEEEATVNVYVMDPFDQPVANASLTLFVDYGNLSATTGVTDQNGTATFNFTASQTLTDINVTITVIATKMWYADGYYEGTITVEPKILDVQVTAEPDALVSEARSNITVHVTYATTPIQDANVTITSESGNFPTTTGLTDSYGNITFIFTAPQANEPTNITITVKAVKTLYVGGETQLTITVNPGILHVTVTAESSTVASRESALVTVHVTCNATPVANVSITLSSSQGNLSATTGLTDSNGYCTFIFNAPRTTEQIPQIIIIANATKNGYISAENQTTITVTAEVGEGGLPLTTILLIIIPIIIAVVVVILIKLKIISISTGEEEQ